MPKLTKPLFLLPAALILLGLGAGLYLFLPKGNNPSIHSEIPVTIKNTTNTANSDITKPSKALLTSTLTGVSTQGGKVSGTLTVTDGDTTGYTGLHYDLYLGLPQSTVVKDKGAPQTISEIDLDYQLSPEFSINPGETKTFHFDLSYSPHIPPNNYQLRSFIFDREDNNLYGTSTFIPLKGSNDLVTFDSSSCSVYIGGKPYLTNVAPPVDPGQSAEGRCTFTNPTNQTLHLTYGAIYSPLHVMGAYQYQKQTKNYTTEITLNPYETKSISFALPEVKEPQVYEALVYLLDSQKEHQSSYASFRWTVRGPSARVEKIELDKDYYLGGDTAKLTVEATPSLDLYWSNPNHGGLGGTNLTNPILETMIYSGDKLCGESSKQMPSTKTISVDKLSGNIWPEVTLSVPISSNCLNPKVTAKVLNDHTLLTSLDKEFVSSKASITGAQQERIRTIILLLTLPIAVIVLIFLVRKFKKGRFFIWGLFILAASVYLYFLHPANTLANITFTGPNSALTADGKTGYFWTNGSSVTVNSDGTSVVTINWHWHVIGCSNSANGFNFSLADPNGYIHLSSNGSKGVTSISGAAQTIRFDDDYYGHRTSSAFDHGETFDAPDTYAVNFGGNNANSGGDADGTVTINLNYVPTSLTLDAESFTSETFDQEYGSYYPTHWCAGFFIDHSSTQGDWAVGSSCLPAIVPPNANYASFCKISGNGASDARDGNWGNTDNNHDDNGYNDMGCYYGEPYCSCGDGSSYSNVDYSRSATVVDNDLSQDMASLNAASDSGVNHLITRVTPCYCMGPGNTDPNTCGNSYSADSCGNANACVGTKSCAPSAPNVTLPACTPSNDNGSDISISWNSSDNNSTLQASPDNFSSNWRGKSISGTSTNASGISSDNPFVYQPGQQWSFRVYNGIYSNAATVTLPPVCDTTPPTAALTNFAAACYTASSTGTGAWPGTITAQATDNSGGSGVAAVYYRIQRDPYSTPAGNCLDSSAHTFTANCSTTNANNLMTLSSGSTYSATIPYTYFTPVPSAPLDNYIMQIKAKDNSGNDSGYSTATNFQVENQCLAPYLQTQQGDVHSNTQINTPGGP